MPNIPERLFVVSPKQQDLVYSPWQDAIRRDTTCQEIALDPMAEFNSNRPGHLGNRTTDGGSRFLVVPSFTENLPYVMHHHCYCPLAQVATRLSFANFNIVGNWSYLRSVKVSDVYEGCPTCDPLPDVSMKEVWEMSREKVHNEFVMKKALPPEHASKPPIRSTVS
jgi:hypothetical protein